MILENFRKDNTLYNTLISPSMIAEIGGYTGLFLGYSLIDANILIDYSMMAFSKAFSFVGVTRVYPIHEK